MNSNITAGFLILLSGAIFYFYINPQYAEINQLQAKQTEYSSAIEKAQQIKDLRAALLSKYNNFDPANLNKLEALLPDNIDNVRLALDLSNIGKNYGIVLKSVKVDKPLDVVESDQNSQPKLYNQAKVTIAFSSTYENFISYVQSIEQSLRIVDVSSITMGPLLATTGKYDFILTLNTYWLK